MHLRLVGEDSLDEVEGVPQVELFNFRHEVVQIYQPLIENLIRLAQKQVDLRDCYHDNIGHRGVQLLTEKAFEQHQNGREWYAKLV